MNLVKTVGSKLDSKMKSGEMNQSELKLQLYSEVHLDLYYLSNWWNNKSPRLRNKIAELDRDAHSFCRRLGQCNHVLP
jgi:hypothetical protein